MGKIYISPKLTSLFPFPTPIRLQELCPQGQAPNYLILVLSVHGQMPQYLFRITSRSLCTSPYMWIVYSSQVQN